MSNRLLQDLNPDQRQAVITTDGPLLVIAGAGSGKTRVLTRRLAYILTQRLAEPYQILAVTFTNKAAGEMKERVNELMGGLSAQMNVSTFHSFCSRFLRSEAAQLGYDTGFTIFDEDDSVTLVKNCIKELNLAGSQFAPKGQRRKISNAKNKMISSEVYAESASGYFETSTAEIYALYQKRLRECNAMDFDDLLFNTVRLLKDFPEVGQRYRRRFKYILVDEYQDTNHVQYLMLKYLVDDHHNICVVGDEDQSIYGWRGADIRNILDFEKDFPGAEIIKLEQNYRSTDIILEAASAVIGNNMARKPKKLWTDSNGGEKLKLMLVNSAADEARHVVEAIDNARSSITLKETAILYRTNAQSRPFEEQLRRINLPYQIVGGISFYHRKEIKDLMAYLKLIVNIRDDVSFGRTINYPLRGIGKKTVEEIARLARLNSIPMYEVALKVAEYPELARARNKIAYFTELIETYRGKKATVPIDIFTQDLVDDMKLIDELRSEDKVIGQTRIENIESFIEGTATFARNNREGLLEQYLDEISLFTDLDNYKEIEDKLTMMTIHTAKGLEYDAVFLVGLEEGLFPLGRAIEDPLELEEERRLFYVGTTRARKRVCLSSATVRHRFGEVITIPSRFLAEIPDNLVDKIDHRTTHGNGYAAQSKMTFESPRRQSRPKTPEGVHYEYEAEEVMRVGRIVQHPTFGRGKITGSEGFGESLRLEIMFAGIGLKKIMAKYAKLKIVG